MPFAKREGTEDFAGARKLQGCRLEDQVQYDTGCSSGKVGKSKAI